MNRSIRSFFARLFGKKQPDSREWSEAKVKLLEARCRQLERDRDAWRAKLLLERRRNPANWPKEKK